MLGAISERSQHSSANMSIRLSEWIYGKRHCGTEVRRESRFTYPLLLSPYSEAIKNVVQQVLLMKQNMGLHNL